jgi:trans-aconitate methyltransferase
VRLLDFGCGWGRIIRYFAKDIPTHLLYGCDPDSNILKICTDLKVPGKFKTSDYRPQRLPFDEKFDLIYAYSVFTHLSENVHRECLETIHNALSPAGIAIITVRPRSYIRLKAGALAFVSDKSIDEFESQFDRGKYVFSPHDIAPVGGEITYGEAVVPDSYIEDNWTRLFELVHPVNIIEDPYQTAVVLRKK